MSGQKATSHIRAFKPNPLRRRGRLLAEARVVVRFNYANSHGYVT
jgi:hypothetical protein